MCPETLRQEPTCHVLDPHNLDACRYPHDGRYTRTTRGQQHTHFMSQEESNIQRSRRENRARSQLPSRAHLQLPNTNDREQQQHKIRGCIHDTSDNVDGIDIKALSGQQRIPKFGSGRTNKYCD